MLGRALFQGFGVLALTARGKMLSVSGSFMSPSPRQHRSEGLGLPTQGRLQNFSWLDLELRLHPTFLHPNWIRSFHYASPWLPARQSKQIKDALVLSLHYVSEADF
jgi:hypothetical protein